VDIAAALRSARDATELSQQQLARRLGIAPSTLSRYEKGRQLPSLAFVDRVLAACGKDLRLVLVDRHADDQAEFARRVALPYARRCPAEALLRPWLLEQLAALGPVVQVGGAWAADLHGVPCDGGEGRLLVAGDDASLGDVAGVLTRRFAQLHVDGEFCALAVTVGTFVRHSSARWFIADAGVFRTEVVAAGEHWPAAVVVETSAGLLRVDPVESLGLGDGVPADRLDRWLAWRATTELPDVPWREPAT
jgi:transcriptional regulator with XRE-family HTH domain